MKITSFNPLIVSNKGEELVKLFESLGFEKRHKVGNIGGNDVTNISMRDPNGFSVDVAIAPNFQADLTVIRINVDDFDEAYDFFTAHGFISPKGRTVESKNSKSVLLVSPSGFGIDLCQHIKD